MKLYHKNPRQITEKQFTDLGGSLSRLGDLGGIVHDLNSDEIIGGNQRSRVFDINQCNIELIEQYTEPDDQGTVGIGFVVWKGKKYAYRQVRWTAKQCEEANIRANKNGGSFDFDTLANEFELDDLLEWGFDKKELDIDLWAGNQPEDPGAQIDKAEELREKWGVESGQLWKLGEHRLICGDCTDKATVEKVMLGEKAQLIVTDPPYGVNYSELRTSQAEMRRTTVEYKDIEKDDFKGEELQRFLELAFISALPSLENNAAWYLWHAQLTQGFFAAAAAAAAAAADIIIHRQIIWVKPSFIFGRGDYHWKHELCFYGWRKGNRPPFYGERNQDTVWNLGGGGSSGGTHKDHPTQKPVEVYEIPLRNHTINKEILFDPFCGSGTAIIACERLHRKCRAVEISPAYCAVAIQRWADMTQGIPELLELQT